ncbi:hypothetical protein BBP40_012213 [Aspergillus hancockii]|nr:hypothetical protein BBP40_012213 [Aspergillus hancockii]
MSWWAITDVPSTPVWRLSRQTSEEYLAKEGAKNPYSFYRLHNYHSLIYASTVAGQSKIALKALDNMEASLTDDILQNPSKPDVLKVATALLDGEVGYRRGNYERAFKSLREQSTKTIRSCTRSRGGHMHEAATTYAQDLGLDDTLTRAHQHPNNVWALHGYHEYLPLLGRAAEARIIKQQLDIALSVADVRIQPSYFYRLGTPKAMNKSIPTYHRQ